MALATRCPHCQTAFRVASDQLKLRAGLVRCGTCKEIFNGIENLLHPDEDIAAAIAASAPPVPEIPILSPVTLIAKPERGDNTRFNNLIAEVDQPEQLHGAAPARPETGAPSSATNASSGGYAASYAPVGLLPLPADQRTAMHTAASANTWPPGPVKHIFPQVHPDADPPDDKKIIAPKRIEPVLFDYSESADQPRHTPDDATGSADLASDHELAMPGLLRPARVDDAPQMQPTAEPFTSAPDPEPGPEPVADIPDFVARDQRRQGVERVTRPLLWVLCLLLALGAIAQTLYVLRTSVAATFPETRMALERACQVLGCSVGLPMQIESVSIESSDFQPVAGSLDQFTLNVLLRNRSSTVQAWPAIELSLSDSSDKPVGRRVLSARDYLPAGVASDRGFSAGSEQAIRLNVDLTRLKASGYRVYVFYP